MGITKELASFLVKTRFEDFSEKCPARAASCAHLEALLPGHVLTDRLAMDLTVTDDPLFHTNVGFSVTYFFGGTSGGFVSPSSALQPSIYMFLPMSKGSQSELMHHRASLG